jgi:hypothetical protein
MRLAAAALPEGLQAAAEMEVGVRAVRQGGEGVAEEGGGGRHLAVDLWRIKTGRARPQDLGLELVA